MSRLSECYHPFVSPMSSTSLPGSLSLHILVQIWVRHCTHMVEKKKSSHWCVSMSACRTRANSFLAEETRSAQSVYEGILPVPTFFCFFLSLRVPKAVASSPTQIASSPREMVQRRCPRGQCWEGHGMCKSLDLSASHYSSLSSSLTHGNSWL